MAAIKLSDLVVGPSDLLRLQRELNALNDFFVEAVARQAGTSMQPPKLTRVLNQLAKDNDVNLLDEAQRQDLTQTLELIRQKAPVLHISFANEASPKAVARLLLWVRVNIHPQALLQIGLQPSIAAGCFVRTPNRVFDLSLRTALKRSQPELQKLIIGVGDGR